MVIAEHDLLIEKDMDEYVDGMVDITKTGGHGHIFCSPFQFDS